MLQLLVKKRLSYSAESTLSKKFFNASIVDTQKLGPPCCDVVVIMLAIAMDRLIAVVLLAIGAGSDLPAIQADCLTRLGSDKKTVTTGTYLIGMDIGVSVGQIFGGIITESFGLT